MASLVEALAATLAVDAATSDQTVALGLAYGTEAFERGASLHHMLKGLDLLNAMSMYTVELAISGERATEGGMVEGVRLCRQLQQFTSFVTLAAAKGYTQAVDDSLCDQFRHLRHDLRNPLGTIKSVLALMDDESMPVDARTHPRFRAMAARNARSLEELIGTELSDVAALRPARSQQTVSLRTIACSVRRDLRGECEARDVRVSVSNRQSRVRVDAVSLELLLRALLLGALQEATAGSTLVLDFPDSPEVAEARTVVVLVHEPTRDPIAAPAVRARLGTLAAQMGAAIEFGERVTLSMPMPRPGERTDDD